MADIRIIINGDPSGGQNALRTIRRELSETKAAADSTSSSFRRIGETTAGFVSAQAVIGAVSKVFDTAKSSIIGFNSQMQNASVGFTTLLGSADAAKNLLSDLALFARQTPFEFPGLLQSSQRLLAFGFSAKDIIPIMTAVGDSVSAMGNVSAEGLNRVTTAIGQMATRGKIQTQEMLQLTEAGIPAFRILADGLGVTTGKLQGMLEQGLIPADRGLKILLEGMENRAPGAMQKMSTTWSGAVSNIKDSLTQLTAGAFKPFFDQLTVGANKLANFLMSDRVARFAADVNAAMDALSKGLSAAFAGKDAEADAYFSQFGAKATVAAKQVELMFLQLADVAVGPLAEMMAEGFANLAQAAVSWGANLVGSLASGMIQGAVSVLSGVISSIAGMIADFFESHSPPKKGPLSKIDVWGANLLTTLFQGMSKADFGALDTVMEGVKNALQAAFGNGGGDDVDFIPRLIGSQAGVAQALDDLKRFGDIASSTIDVLNANLGDAADSILGLIRNVADLAAKDADIARLNAAIEEWDTKLAAVDVEIGKVKRSMDEIKRKYDEQRRPIEDAIRTTERYYDSLIRNADLAVRKLQAQIAAQERLRQPQMAALDAEERGLNVSLARQRLADAENQHNVRRTDLERDVASAQRSVGDAKDPVSRADALYRLQQAQQRLAREGHQTDQDRLDILNARRDLLNAELAISTAGARAELTTAQSEKDRLEQERDDSLAGKRDQLEDINDAEREELRVLDERLGPLQRQKDLLEESKREQEEALRLAEAQRKPIADAVDLTLDRLSHEADLSSELDKQLDLMNRIAEAAAAAAKGRAGAGGAGSFNPNIGAGLGLNIPKPFNANDPNQSPVGGDPIAPPDIDEQLKALRKKISKEFRDGVKDGFEEGFKDWNSWDITWTAIGAGIGFMLGGPVGAALGAVIGKGLGDWLQGAGEVLGRLGHGLLDKIFGETNFKYDTVGDRIRDGLAPIFKAERWKEFGGWLVDGLWDGVKWAWDGFLAFLGGAWEQLVKQFKGTFGIDSPSRLFHQFGEWLVEGLWNGIAAIWSTLLKWAGDRWDDLVSGIEKRLGIEGSSSSVFHRIGTIIITGLKVGAESIWTDLLKPFAEALPGNLKDALGNTEMLGDLLKATGKLILKGLLAGLKAIWEGLEGIAAWLGKLAGEMVKSIGTDKDLGNLLWNAGWTVMSGLWEGLKAMWDQHIGPWLASRPSAIQGALGDALKNPEDIGGPLNPRNRKTLPGEDGFDDKGGLVDKGRTRSPGGGMVGGGGGWEPGPNGTQILWTGPETYWIRFPDGRVEQHSTLEPDHPLKAMTGGTGGLSAFVGGTGGGGFRGPTTHAMSGNGISEQNTNNFAGIVGLLQTIYSDQFGTFTNYSSTAPGLEAIVGPLEDFLRRLPGMSQELKDALNALIMEQEARRNPVNASYDPLADPVAKLLNEVSGTLQNAADAQVQAAEKLGNAADRMAQDEGPSVDDTGEYSDEEGDGGRTRTGVRKLPKPQRALGGPLPADGWYYGHAGETVNAVGTVNAQGGGGGYGGLPPIIIQTVYGFEDFRAKVREATGMDIAVRRSG